MATAIQINGVAENDDFKKRVRYFMVKAAIAVKAEAPTTPGNVERSAYADKVLSGSASVLQHVLAALTNGTLAAAADLSAVDHGITDTSLEFAVNEMWNAMSGFDSGT